MKLISPIAIVLDTTPLGLLTQKKNVPEAELCRLWYRTLIQAGCLFFVPEIADYELRREFLRQGNEGAITRLQTFNSAIPSRCLPLTTPAVRLAAELWAKVRNQGRTTASPVALDADVLIAAQAELLNFAAFNLSAVVVATANIGHLSVLTAAVFWSGIQP